MAANSSSGSSRFCATDVTDGPTVILTQSGPRSAVIEFVAQCPSCFAFITDEAGNIISGPPVAFHPTRAVLVWSSNHDPMSLTGRIGRAGRESYCWSARQPILTWRGIIDQAGDEAASFNALVNSTTADGARLDWLGVNVTDVALAWLRQRGNNAASSSNGTSVVGHPTLAPLPFSDNVNHWADRGPGSSSPLIIHGDRMSTMFAASFALVLALLTVVEVCRCKRGHPSTAEEEEMRYVHQRAMRFCFKWARKALEVAQLVLYGRSSSSSSSSRPLTEADAAREREREAPAAVELTVLRTLTPHGQGQRDEPEETGVRVAPLQATPVEPGSSGT